MQHAHYNISLVEVERPADTKERYGKQTISQLEGSEGVVKYLFEDDLIKTIWLVTPYGISFDLHNKSDHSVKIIWDEAVYVDNSGRSMRVMHSGVKYAERNNPQLPTVIVRKGMVKDSIHPTDYVFFVEGKNGGWSEGLLFGPISSKLSRELEAAKEHVGKSIQVLLPIEIEGIVNEYIFRFKINDVQIE